MDELAALLEKLQGEVTALEAALDSRAADEASQLRVEETRLKAAEERQAGARARLSVDGAALATLDARRAQLLERIGSWRGELWRLGHASAVMALLMASLAPLPVVGVWLGPSWMLGLGLTELLLFGAAYFVIPEKR